MKNEEIKEILDRLDFNEWEVDLYEVPIAWCELYNIRDYITNLQQLYENALKVNQNENKYRTELESKYVLLQQENETLKAKLEIGKTCGFCPYYDYKSRCEGTINLIDRTIEIIKQQPTKDDSWILSRLYGFKYALNGSDAK